MFSKTIKLSEKGQIVLPRELRRRAGIMPGDTLLIAQKGDRILIERSTKSVASLEEDFLAWDDASDEALDAFEKSI